MIQSLKLHCLLIFLLYLPIATLNSGDKPKPQRKAMPVRLYVDSPLSQSFIKALQGVDSAVMIVGLRSFGNRIYKSFESDGGEVSDWIIANREYLVANKKWLTYDELLKSQGQPHYVNWCGTGLATFPLQESPDTLLSLITPNLDPRHMREAIYLHGADSTVSDTVVYIYFDSLAKRGIYRK